MIEAVSRYGYALYHASDELLNGGLKKHLEILQDNVYNVLKQTFIATVLFGAKANNSSSSSSSSEGDEESRSASTRPCLCDNSDCVLSLLRPSMLLPASLSTQIKRLIWNFAGVRSGQQWNVIEAAAINMASLE